MCIYFASQFESYRHNKWHTISFFFFFLFKQSNKVFQGVFLLLLFNCTITSKIHYVCVLNFLHLISLSVSSILFSRKINRSLKNMYGCVCVCWIEILWFFCRSCSWTWRLWWFDFFYCRWLWCCCCFSCCCTRSKWNKISQKLQFWFEIWWKLNLPIWWRCRCGGSHCICWFQACVRLILLLLWTDRWRYFRWFCWSSACQWLTWTPANQWYFTNCTSICLWCLTCTG